jgi:arylsulfatase A-like enzyme
MTLLLTLACSRPAPQPNLLMVTLDTTRADHVLNGRTPVMAALGARGAVFERALTPVPITLPAHTTLMTGLDPQQHGVRNNGYTAPPSLQTLAETLAAEGYATAAVVAAAPLRASRGLDQGFAHYDEGDLKAVGADIHAPERGAEEVTAAALRVLDGLPEPWFVWVHYFDPHAPWTAPVEGDESPYQAEIRVLDSALKPLLDRVDAEDLVVLTADHGEALGEHGEPTHGYFLHDATLAVPLVLAGPGVPVKTVGGTARLRDVHDTALYLMGLGTEPALASWEAVDRPAYAETLMPMEALGLDPVFAWSSGELRLVESPTKRLFVLSDETVDVAAQRIDDAERLSTALQAERGPLPLPAGRTMDPELVALGYLDASELGAGEVYDNTELIRVSMALYSGTHLETDELMEVLRAWPTAPELHRRGLPLLAGTPHYEEALRHAAMTFTDDPSIQAQAAYRWFRTDPALATAALDRLLAAEGAVPVAALVLGTNAALGLGRAGDAEALARRAMERELTNLDVRYDRARLIHGMGWLEPAVAEYRILVKARPEDAEAWRNLGYALAAMGQTTEAVDALDRSLALEGDLITRQRRDQLVSP